MMMMMREYDENMMRMCGERQKQYQISKRLKRGFGARMIGSVGRAEGNVVVKSLS